MFVFDPGMTGIQGVLSILYILTAVFICFMIIFENRNPLKTLSWIMVVLLIPFVGIIVYIFFGQNYRKQKIFSRKGLVDLEQIADYAERQVISLPEELVNDSPAIREKEHLMKLMLNNNRSALTRFNNVELLIDGEETFPAMADAIASAKDYIHLQFYRIEPDMLGTQFKDLLKRKALEGVKVRVIFDDVGSWNIKNSYLKEVRDAGIEIYPFMPVRFPLLTNKINFRNHRKIVVVDGVTGFVGGLNIADKYLHGLKDLGPWRDTHLKVTGEAVVALNSVFLADWYFVSGEAITNVENYFKHQKVDNRCLIQVASGGPDSDWATIMQVYFSAIATAKRTIYLSSPYFSPDDSILNALLTASLSGVDVKIIFPRRSDSVVANWNTRSYISELLDAGIRVYLFEQGFSHSKYLLVDGIFASVGSPNVDIRSFELNFEVTALIYDESFAADLGNLFSEDLKKCSEVNRQDWEKRKRSDKYKESLARILGPLY
jgi:cardiolipin synthase A/B